MEIALTVIIYVLVAVLIWNIIDLLVNGSRVDPRDILETPYLTVGDTKLEEYINSKIKWAIEESEFKQRENRFQNDIDMLRLARILGYTKLEAGEWKEIDGKNKKS